MPRLVSLILILCLTGCAGPLCQPIASVARQYADPEREAGRLIAALPFTLPKAQDTGGVCFANDYLNPEDTVGYYEPGRDKVYILAGQIEGGRERAVLHEEAHATGHYSRLNRLAPGKSWQFAEEEVRAETAAAMLLSLAGLDTSYSRRYVRQYMPYTKLDKEALKTDSRRIAAYLYGREVPVSCEF